MAYYYSFLKPHHPYLPRWNEFRRRRKFFWLALASLPLSIGLLQLVLLPLHLWLKSDVAVLIAGALALAGVMAVNFYCLGWPCPRCGKPFHLAWWCGSLWCGKCLHCGLLKYAPCDPAEQQMEFESHVD